MDWKIVSTLAPEILKDMDIEDVRRLVAGNEGSNIEFKETTGQLERGMETLCAFLNGEGGTVLFGVTDKGKIVGQEVTDSTKRAIAEAINRLEPTTAVKVFYVPVNEDEKCVVALHVKDMRYDRPFCYKSRPYMRCESVTLAMPQSTYTELIFQREGMAHGWESYIDEKLDLSDLDEEEILKTVRLGIDCGRLPESTDRNIPNILEKLGVSENGKLKHAAAILFANGKLADYPQCLLRMARFRGKDKAVFIDNQRVFGNIFKLLDAAMAFVFKHLSLSATTERLEREEHLEIPYRAIREAVVNCLCHRSYRELGGSASIAIYDDRVEICNPGSLPQGWDIEKLENSHESMPQNPKIADVLYVRKVLESWGRGVDLMRSECSNVNISVPIYKIGGGSVSIVFQRKSEQVVRQVSGQPSEQVGIQVNTNDNEEVNKEDKIQAQIQVIQPSEQVVRQVSGQVTKLVCQLSTEKLSVSKIMEKFSATSRGKFYELYLIPALDLGLIAKTHPDKPNHPQQKYYLTDKGLALLKDVQK